MTDSIQITIKVIHELSNFFPTEFYVCLEKENASFMYKNGNRKPIKLPQNLLNAISDKRIFTKTIEYGGEKSTLYIFRLGDGFNLLIPDTGTGTSINSFIVSLLTMASDFTDYDNQTAASEKIATAHQLAQELTKLKREQAIINKRAKEEKIILEAQARQSMQELARGKKAYRELENGLTKLNKQLIETNESNRHLSKKLKDMELDGDFRQVTQLKKKVEVLTEELKNIKDMYNNTRKSLEEFHGDVLLYSTSVLDEAGMSEEKIKELENELINLYQKALSNIV